MSAICVRQFLRARDTAGGGVESVGMSEELQGLYRRRAAHQPIAAPRATATDDSLPAAPAREPLDEATAQLLFPMLTRGYVFDPAMYYRRAANLEITRELAESRETAFSARTNSLGMREDTEPLASRPDWRLIVAGASNVEGVCANESSATNVLEARLRRLFPGRSIEALNAGAGGYNLYNDLGVLERYRELHPDVFVLVAYGGNDFFGCARVQRYFEHRDVPKHGPRTLASMDDAEKFTRELGGTELSQIVYFKNNPEDLDIVVDTAWRLTAEMQRICSADGIRFVCVYLPPPLAGQPELFAEARTYVLKRQKMTADDLALSDRIADKWLAFLEAHHIEHLDLRPTFRASKARLYWQSDTHVNLIGQKVIAGALLPFAQPAQ